MRLLYDLRLLEEGMHGMARYALELLSGLLSLDEDMEVTVLVRAKGDGRIPRDGRVSELVCDLAPYSLKAQVSLPKEVGRFPADLYHCPFYAPLARYQGPMVISIHDLIHLRFPHDYGLSHRLYYRLVLGPLARGARLIITGSEHSKQDLVQLMGVPPARVVVTPYGVAPGFRPPEPEDREAVRRRLGLPDSFILGVGNPKPHKNLAALVEAHDLLRAEYPDSPPLALLGADGSIAEGEATAEGRVMALGRVAEADMAGLYAAAEMVVLPSVYEGFGLPALEAMAAGAPVVASDRASLPEVVGDAGLLAEPDPAGLARAMARLLGEEGLAERLIQAGKQRAAAYTWRRTAEQTWQAYQWAMSNRGRP